MVIAQHLGFSCSLDGGTEVSQDPERSHPPHCLRKGLAPALPQKGPWKVPAWQEQLTEAGSARRGPASQHSQGFSFRAFQLLARNEF